MQDGDRMRKKRFVCHGMTHEPGCEIKVFLK